MDSTDAPHGDQPDEYDRWIDGEMAKLDAHVWKRLPVDVWYEADMRDGYENWIDDGETR